MTQRTNSPISDPVPFEAPAIAAMEKRPQTEGAKLGKSKKWPEVTAYLEGRIEFYRQYMPDGTAIPSLTEAEAGRWWKCAATIIAELENFKNRIESEVRASKDM